MKRKTRRGRLSAALYGAPLLLAALAGCSGSSLFGSPSAGVVSDPVPQDPNATIQAGQIVGGGTKEMAVDASAVGKFLPRPELLVPGEPGRADLVYFNPKVPLSNYHKIMIDPVTIWAGPNSAFNNVPADQQRALANAAFADVYDALKGYCDMVQTASPGTIHFHFALVDIKEPNAVINTVATYAPYASSAYSLASFAFNHGVGYFAGTATGQGFATDAMDGTLLWQAVDKRGGTTTFAANTLDNWRDVRHVFEAWGVLLRERLQREGVCRK
jgi:hypothetical protein